MCDETDPFGRPGAARYQAEILCDKLGIPTISTGNILRAAVKDGTPMGKGKGFMDAGALVPDDVIVGIVKERLAEPDCEKGFILDGMPRTIAQGEALEQMGVDIDKVVNLIVPDEAITRRMSGRRVCAKCGASYHIVNKPSAKEGVCDRCGGELAIRKDDEPATVLDRLKAYHEQTEPLVEFYRQRGKLVEVPDQGSIEATTAFLLKLLGLIIHDPNQKCCRAAKNAQGLRYQRSCLESRWRSDRTRYHYR